MDRKIGFSVAVLAVTLCVQLPQSNGIRASETQSYPAQNAGALFTAGQAEASKTFPSVPSGPYFGQVPPGRMAVLFAPGIITTGLYERDVAISTKGDEIYFSVMFRAISTIMVTRLENSQWTEPEVASFAADPNYYHLEPCLSYDGRRIFFLTNRPRSGEPPKAGWANQNIWAADRKDSGAWGAPYDLGAPINAEGGSYFPSVTQSGTLYFIRTKALGKDGAVYRSRFAEGRFSEPERLPDSVNGYAVTFNAFIAPDESYLIAGVEGREDSTPPKKPNYYVFFRNRDGTWTSGHNLGPEINDPANTVHSPYVSPDGRYFFFASNAARGRITLQGMTLRQLIQLNSTSRNGNSDIYWVSIEVVEKLRPATK